MGLTFSKLHSWSHYPILLLLPQTKNPPKTRSQCRFAYGLGAWEDRNVCTWKPFHSHQELCLLLQPAILCFWKRSNAKLEVVKNRQASWTCQQDVMDKIALLRIAYRCSSTLIPLITICSEFFQRNLAISNDTISNLRFNQQQSRRKHIGPLTSEWKMLRTPDAVLFVSVATWASQVDLPIPKTFCKSYWAGASQSFFWRISWAKMTGRQRDLGVRDTPEHQHEDLWKQSESACKFVLDRLVECSPW